MISCALHVAVTCMVASSFDFLSSNVSTSILYAAGTNILLITNVETDVISLSGRWKSDMMLLCPHLQVKPTMHKYPRYSPSIGQQKLLKHHTTFVLQEMYWYVVTICD